MPSLSYLRRIQMVDRFVILDNVQRVARGFENRNKLVDNQGKEHWVSIPIESSTRTLIKDTKIFGKEWTKEHKAKISQWYGKDIAEMYSQMITDSDDYRTLLVYQLKAICKLMNIETDIVQASDYKKELAGGIDELIELTKLVDCNVYVSGSTCLSYGLDKNYANKNGIELEIDHVSGIHYGFIHDFALKGLDYCIEYIHNTQYKKDV